MLQNDKLKRSLKSDVKHFYGHSEKTKTNSYINAPIGYEHVTKFSDSDLPLEGSFLVSPSLL